MSFGAIERGEAVRVLVLGGNGMLGHKAYQVFDGLFETWTTVRFRKEELKRFSFFDLSRVVDGVEAGKFESVRRAVGEAAPDVVVNCMGIVKQLKEVEVPSAAIMANALFPHLLHELCSASGIRLIQISTDCVFSGKIGNYREDSQPDAEDLYGRTKLLGEVTEKNSLTLRTSMIGRELDRTVGLVEWLLSQKGKKVQGYRNAIFTGFTTKVLSGILADIIARHPRLTGLYHLSSNPISKFDLLCLVRDIVGVDVEIAPSDHVFCDRSLNSSRFRKLVAFEPPSWREMINGLAVEMKDYAAWRGELLK